jgi:hypothetical protein
MLIIDRFEGGFAVIETSIGMINIPIADLPSGAKENDVLQLVISESETENRKQKISGMMNYLFKD